jgi:hypothetical protein
VCLDAADSINTCMLNYAPPNLTKVRNRPATLVVLGLTLIIPIAFVAFYILRKHQLSLPDPYNNPYTNLSTACLLTVLLSWMADFVALVALRSRIYRPVVTLASVVVGIGGAYVVWFFIGMLRMVFP